MDYNFIFGQHFDAGEHKLGLTMNSGRVRRIILFVTASLLLCETARANSNNREKRVRRSPLQQDEARDYSQNQNSGKRDY